MTQLNAAIESAQFLDQLTHALGQNALGVPYPATRRAVQMAVWARYELCCDLGMGSEAGALVLQHRFKVAGR